MRVDVQKVADSAAFPFQVDVVVIAAGIVGTRKGVSVALFEKGIVAGEQNRDIHEPALAMYS